SWRSLRSSSPRMSHRRVSTARRSGRCARLRWRAPRWWPQSRWVWCGPLPCSRRRRQCISPRRSSNSSASDTNDWVTASEIAAYEYCGRAYWLDRSAARDADTDAERFDAGIQAHQSHTERVAKARKYAVVALVASIVLLLAAAIVWLSR